MFESVIVLDGRNIEDAVAEGAEGDGGAADVRLIREGDAQEANIVDDGRTYRCDQEEDRGHEEESDADPDCTLACDCCCRGALPRPTSGCDASYAQRRPFCCRDRVLLLAGSRAMLRVECYERL